MKENTKYTGGYTKHSQIIIWFWEAVESFDQKLLASLVFFLTGSCKVPHGGFKEFGLEIEKTYDLSHLPMAHIWYLATKLIYCTKVSIHSSYLNMRPRRTCITNFGWRSSRATKTLA